MSEHAVLESSPTDEQTAPIEAVELEPATPEAPTGSTLFHGVNPAIVEGLHVKAHVALGQASLTVKELFNLKENSLVPLDTLTDDLLELTVDGHKVARGRLVIQGDRFGIEVVDVAADAV
ncbi:FliM/FliN family flagellar motor switch protein [Parendozoicomonas haliclonae]|uniref:Flagellar motor switch protein FliN n=1 Tax=Parendozoicomonas haliclonae TaxID=1960125 RepID=A0A1X7ANJ2_9GAMM|nr:FliM/FliN family flagellar motor C-terminal domain-containing protein [Parendozoicomonas haliclonae]SMA49891.1 Flagellar motor switch protein FliN [Parendozoicomonas haliclonae]